KCTTCFFFRLGHLLYVLSSMFTFSIMFAFFFFFFQAEDGIRDWSVTGVQTCALPISPRRPPARSRAHRGRRAAAAASRRGLRARSEERRVGKECRSRWAPDH